MGEVPGSIPGTALLRSGHASGLSPARWVSGVIFAQVSTVLLVARLAQLVERKALNLVVVGSSPTVGRVLFPTPSRASWIIAGEVAPRCFSVFPAGSPLGSYCGVCPDAHLGGWLVASLCG